MTSPLNTIDVDFTKAVFIMCKLVLAHLFNFQS